MTDDFMAKIERKAKHRIKMREYKAERREKDRKTLTPVNKLHRKMMIEDLRTGKWYEISKFHHGEFPSTSTPGKIIKYFWVEASPFNKSQSKGSGRMSYGHFTGRAMGAIKDRSFHAHDPESKYLEGIRIVPDKEVRQWIGTDPLKPKHVQRLRVSRRKNKASNLLRQKDRQARKRRQEEQGIRRSY